LKARDFFVDAFGNPHILKRSLILAVGLISWPRFNLRNKLNVQGMEQIKRLPEEGVLFISNHQTYYADVAAMYHVFNAARWGFKSTRNPIYLLNPKTRFYFVAARETMNSGILPRIFKIGGAISVQRTWREKGQEINREVNPRDTSQIEKAIDHGWVITFPQGTTTPFERGRKGTAHIIQETQPLVVPIVIDGFRRAFDKKGLRMKKRGHKLRMTIKEPLQFDSEMNTDDIMGMVMESIEQSEEFNLVHGTGAPGK
jgi:1-acyl-sn-glycerol-3-phosphate acyltransferase